MKRVAEDGASANAQAPAQGAQKKEELQPEDLWVPGKPAPDDVKNPPAGDTGHRCVDPEGRYQPSWYSVHIDKTPTTPEVLYLSSDKGGWRVRTGQWVDVPPDIVERLRGCSYTDEATDVVNTTEGPKRIVRRVDVPRFSLSFFPSA